MAYQRPKHPVYHGGMNNAEQIAEQFLCCPLCHAPGLRNGKRLTCGHSACSTCLDRVVPQRPGAVFACPVCHSPVVTPPLGVQGFPDDLFASTQIDRLLRRHNQQRRRDDTFYLVDDYEIGSDGHARIKTDVRN